MRSCPHCEFVSSRGTALASHIRHRHPQPPAAPPPPDPDGPNLAAVKVTIGELDRLGRFELVDEAVRQSLLTMADTLDRSPKSAQMWRQYREMLMEVLRADDEADDELAAALARINSAAAVGDASAG